MGNYDWQDYLSRNLGKISGILLGLFLGWMVIHYGLFKTLFVAVLVFIGYVIGKQLDDGDSIGDMIDRIFRRS